MGKIVEFMGIPGSGKSTILDGVCQELIGQGKKVCDDTAIYDDGRFSRWIHLIRAFIDLRNMKYNVSLLLILFNSFGWKEINKVIPRYFKLVKLNGQIRSQIKKNNFVVLSEGYLQVFLSMFDDGRLDVDMFKKFICLLPKKNWILVHIVLDIDIASNRIDQRAHKDDSWRELESSCRVNKLKIRDCNNKLAASYIQNLLINGNDIIEKNVSSIINVLS